MKKKKKKIFSIKGFTILELLAAVVIIGIILTIAIIAINKYITQGHNTVDNQIEKQLILGAKSYFSDNKTKFITDSDTGVVIWYTTLKANDYISNDLVDSDGNSCSKSYVVVKKDGSKYTYSGCVICDNGYNNTSDKKECSESLANNIYCEWYDGNTKLNENTKIYMGTKKNNEKELTLKCKGNNIKFKNPISKTYLNDIKRLVSDMFDTVNGSVIIENDFTSKTNKSGISSFDALIKYRATGDGTGSITFKNGSSYVIDRNQEVYNEDTIYDGIVIDGKGPSCSLSGAYSDKELTNSINLVKSNSNVYYKLTCSDNNNVNGTITKDGFEKSSGISDIEIISTDGTLKEKSAIIRVGVVSNSTTKLNLVYKDNQLYDDYDNYNSIVENNNTLTIDATLPTCSFTGPYSNYNLTYSKTKMNINDSSDFVYYGLNCSDEVGIIDNFNINNIVNNNFGRIEYVTTNSITNGYQYVIKAYTNTIDATGYLSYNTNNTIDKVGNKGNGIINSNSVKMVDYSKVPTCNININYSSDYRSATLTGYMYDSYGLIGYKWTSDYGSPSSYSYISGTSNYVSNTINENGWYYLHMKNENDLTNYCLAYVSQIKPAPPSTPIISASDSIASGNWHNSNYSLYASGSGSNVVYYYGTSSSNITSTSEPSITEETSGTIYYAKACRSEDSTNCSSYTTYNAKLDKTAPSCSLYFKTDNYYSDGGSKTYYSSNEASTVYIELICNDSLSGVKSTALYKDGADSGFKSKMKLSSTGTYTVKAIAYDNANNKMDGSNHTVKIACTLGDWGNENTVYVTSKCTSSTSDTVKIVCGTEPYQYRTAYTASDDDCSKYKYSYTTIGTAYYSCTGGCNFSTPTGIEGKVNTTSCTSGKYYYTDVECVACVKGTVSDGKCSSGTNNACNKYSYTKKKCNVSCSSYTYSNYVKGETKIYKNCSSTASSKGSVKTYYTCGSTTYYTKTTSTRSCN